MTQKHPSSNKKMTTDWILRVGDGNNFIHSTKHRIWAVQSKYNTNSFLEKVKPGDRLWFVKSNTNGKIIAVATYRSHNKRVFGPLINLSMTNQELGWTFEQSKSTIYDTELHYTDLYGLERCELLTHIKTPRAIRAYDDKCRINLPLEYSNIVRYSKVTVDY
jgi:hypothetical protein